MTDKHVLRNFVDGAYVEPADGGYADLVDPCTGEVFAAAPVSGAGRRRRARWRAAADARSRAGATPPRPSGSGRC